MAQVANLISFLLLFSAATLLLANWVLPEKRRDALRERTADLWLHLEYADGPSFVRMVSRTGARLLEKALGVRRSLPSRIFRAALLLFLITVPLILPMPSPLYSLMEFIICFPGGIVCILLSVSISVWFLHWLERVPRVAFGILLVILHLTIVLSLGVGCIFVTFFIANPLYVMLLPRADYGSASMETAMLMATASFTTVIAMLAPALYIVVSAIALIANAWSLPLKRAAASVVLALAEAESTTLTQIAFALSTLSGLVTALKYAFF